MFTRRLGGTYGAKFREAISYKHDTPTELKMAGFQNSVGVSCL